MAPVVWERCGERDTCIARQPGRRIQHAVSAIVQRHRPRNQDRIALQKLVGSVPASAGAPARNIACPGCRGSHDGFGATRRPTERMNL